MMKIIIVLCGVLILGCNSNIESQLKIKEVDNTVVTKLNDTLVAKKNRAISISDSIKNIDTTKSILNQFNGKWIYKRNNDIQDYRINILVDNKTNSVTGSHCFIRGEMGDEIDCPDSSFKGVYSNGEITGRFKSDMTNKYYKCKLSIKSNELVLNLINEPGTSFFTKSMEYSQLVR